MESRPEIPAEVHKRPKGSVLYLHAPGGRYDCQDCTAYIPGDHNCILMGPEVVVAPEDSCGYFIPGPYQIGARAQGWLTPQETGFTKSVGGASCKRCEYWNPDGDCMLVDKDSPGDDPGTIHGDACCCLWEGKD